MRAIIFNPNKIKTTILLDLNEVDLYIWEQRKSFQDIQQKLEELISGKDFLPIPLGKIDEKKYFLHPYIINKQTGLVDGGHHRSAAYYLTDRKLIGTIFPSPICDLNQQNPDYPTIKEMIIEFQGKDYFLKEFKQLIQKNYLK